MPQIRTSLLIIATIHLIVGCAESPQQTAPAPQSIENDKNKVAIVEGQQSNARQVVDDAIEAFGGSAATALIRRGYVKIKIVGEMPGLSEKFGTNEITMESYFDLPDYERRDVYGVPQGEHFLSITNSGRLWVGDQAGRGKVMPAPPKSVYRGPLNLAIIQNIIELQEYSLKLVPIDDQDCSVVVVDANRDEQLFCRISFDRATRLPIQIEKMMPSMRRDNFGELEQTTTKLSEYRQFGAAILPTDVVMLQGDTPLVRFSIVSADFERPVSKDQFVILESPTESK
jgi:hypothetical protein